MSFQVSGIQDLWCCPKSRSKLIVVGDLAICSDPDCRLQYAIKDGIPVMLIDDATLLTPEAWQAVIKNPS